MIEPSINNTIIGRTSNSILLLKVGFIEIDADKANRSLGSNVKRKINRESVDYV